MNILRWILLGEAVVIAALVILLLLVLIWNLLRKRVVTVPSMSLTVGKPQYDHGETVDVSGIVSKDVGVPAPGETVDLKLTDSTEVEYPVGTAVTDADGKYAASFPVPDAIAPGGVTVTATVEALGVAAQATFTRLR